jgi:hypothetical protein
MQRRACGSVDSLRENRNWSILSPVDSAAGSFAAACAGGNMDTTTLLIIILVVLVLFGGGWYGRGRWF